MKTITDERRIDEVYAEYASFFSSRPPLVLLRVYGKGEVLNDPLRPMREFLIVAEGGISIYDITEDGEIRYISRAGKGTLLGDMEFCGTAKRTFFTEASEKVLCLYIPFRENCSALEDDPVFLRFIISELGRKLSFKAVIDVTSGPLEEKLLMYLREMNESHAITSVNETMHVLHSSRRQLQRALSSLTEKGVIEKTGRGCYRLKWQRSGIRANIYPSTYGGDIWQK